MKRAVLALATAWIWAGAAPAQGPRDASLEDLVRASGGRLGVYARNLETGAEVSLNGAGTVWIGSLTRLPAAEAALKEARGRPTSTNIAATVYQREHYRGRDGLSGREFGRSYSIQELVVASLSRDDPAASDLLEAGGTAAVAPHPSDWGPTPTHGQMDRDLVSALQPDFSRLETETLQRWWRDHDRSALHRAGAAEDPRLGEDWVRRVDRAFESLYASGAHSAPLASFAQYMERLHRGTGWNPEDRELVLEALRSTPRLAACQNLPLHWECLGLDARSWKRWTSAALVHTQKGPLVLVATAQGYPGDGDSERLLAVMGEAAIRRLAPGLHASAGDPEGPAPLPTGVSVPVLQTPRRASAGEVLRAGETARLSLSVLQPHGVDLSVRWTRPDGTHRREHQRVPPRTTEPIAFDAPVTHVGWHEVELALGPTVIHRARFQVRPRE